MLQRVQTLYLLLTTGIALGLIWVFDLYKDSTGTAYYAIDLLNTSEPLLLLIPILFIVSGLMSLISIFLYKKRQHQFVINRLNILINLFLLGVLIYHLLNISGEALVSKKGIGVVLPIVAIVLLAMANKAIKKDEDLVKSVDRLR